MSCVSDTSTTAKENCVENFENTAENNQRLQSEQDCPCDTEHMYSCPAGSKTVSTKSHVTSQQMAALNGVSDVFIMLMQLYK